MADEFGTTEGTSPAATEQKFDIGWYLSAMLEDPLIDEPMRAAISEWFACNDETSLRYKSLIEVYQKDTEELLNLNRQLRNHLTDAAHRGQVMFETNQRLKFRFDKLVKFFPIAVASSSLFVFIMTYTVMLPK